MTLELKTPLPAPEFNNSAGRLLVLLQSFTPRRSYFEIAAEVYGGDTKSSSDFKAKAYLSYMGLVGDAFDDFIHDIEHSPKIPDATRDVIKEGLATLLDRAYPIQPNAAPSVMPQAEIGMLRLAGSMLESEAEMTNADAESIRKSIDDLRNLLEDSELSKSARVALLEIVRLSRNALDHYTIHGARGFKDAFKKMLAELMDVYFAEGKEVVDETWWKKSMSHLNLVDTIAGRLLKYKPLLENAGTLFLSASDQIPPPI